MSVPLFELRDVCVDYALGNSPRRVLDGLNLAVSAGDWIMIRGSNGSGKSTLLRAIAGQVPVASGELRFESANAALCRGIYMVHQDPMSAAPATLTVFEALWIADKASPRNKREARGIYAPLLAPYGLETHLAAPIFTLSGGQRQMISLLMASLSPLQVLLLDEPTAALDKDNETVCMDLISKLDRSRMALVHVTHNLEHYGRFGNRRFEMQKGRLVPASPDGIL